MRRGVHLLPLLAMLAVGGCALTHEQPLPPTGKPAAGARETTPPRPVRRRGDERPESYVVQRGDTLYAIALDFGFDYRELAAWNDLRDPSRILVGQRLRFTAPPRESIAEIRAAPGAPAVTGEVLPGPGTAAAPGRLPVLSEPKAQTLAYSDPALAQMNRAAGAPGPRNVPDKAAAVEEPKAVARAPVPAGDKPPVAEDEEALEWVWPVRGEILYRFGESGRLKGVGIGGKAGDPVGAAAAGKVVYSGSGLRGYGQLVIVKHNETYLSVYAHNSALAVKEGDAVKRGQKIAEMGDSDATRVGLHFEIRRFGKPVDPFSRLPGS